MKYECWYGNNFTRIHTDECIRRAVDSDAEHAMARIAAFDTIEEAIQFADLQGHRVDVCKVCYPDANNIRMNDPLSGHVNFAAAWLLTWNPAKWPWDDREHAVSTVRSGRPYRLRWSCANTHVLPGDRVFLLRQGKVRPGIVASGYATTKPFVSPHWSNDEKSIRYIDVIWDRILNPDNSAVLSREILVAGSLAEGPWNSQQSGVTIAAPVATMLGEAWDAHYRNVTRNDSAVLALENETANDFAIEDRLAEVKVRTMQSAFRRKVLANFEGKCCLTGATESDLLIASHIVPWAVQKECRLDPANGLCLFITFDRLFDFGYISFDDDLKVLSCPAKSLSPSVRDLVLDIQGMQAVQPHHTKINPEFLAYHREHILKT